MVYIVHAAHIKHHKVLISIITLNLRRRRTWRRGGGVWLTLPLLLLLPPRAVWGLDPVLSSAVSGCVASSQSQNLSVAASSPKINAVVVIMIITDLT